MITFRSRRWRNWAVLFACCLVVLLAYKILTLRLRPTSFYSGWLLLGLMLVLAGYNIFKRLSFLPLGASSTWLQFHIYAGWLTVLLFVIHLGLRLPQKPLGIIMTTLYVLVAGSGILGLALSRWLTPRLAVRGPEVIYERIPTILRHLRTEAEEIVLRSVTATNSTSIADFYARQLKSFFDGPRHFWRHLVHSEIPRRALLAETRDERRYMNKEEHELLDALTRLVRTKDDLDYQYAVQSSLKYWLFVHVPLTYSLLIFSAVHVVLVHVYSGVVW
jgi:hypothetical protein